MGPEARAAPAPAWTWPGRPWGPFCAAPSPCPSRSQPWRGGQGRRSVRRLRSSGSRPGDATSPRRWAASGARCGPAPPPIGRRLGGRELPSARSQSAPGSSKQAPAVRDVGRETARPGRVAAGGRCRGRGSRWGRGGVQRPGRPGPRLGEAVQGGPAPGGGRAERRGTGRGRGEASGASVREAGRGRRGREGSRREPAPGLSRPVGGGRGLAPRGQGARASLTQGKGGLVDLSLSLMLVSLSCLFWSPCTPTEVLFLWSYYQAIQRWWGPGWMQVRWGLKQIYFVGGCKEICKIIKTKLVTQYVFV